MRLPVIPLVVAATVLSAAVYLFTSLAPPRRVLDAPRLSRLADLEGVETEVAISPDGNRFAVIVSGDLWVLNLPDGARQRLTQTPEAEASPAWAPDGKRVTFTRGPDTLAISEENGETVPFLKNATSVTWAPDGRIAFVRERGLWLSDSTGQDEKQLVEADPNTDITIRSPGFSPDASQIAFIKSTLHLRGEVWTVDVKDAKPTPIVADRNAENPSDVGWILGGKQIIYLTNRSGLLALWHVDLTELTILPLTQALITVPLRPVGMAVWKDRMVLPRHFVESNIETSGGKMIVQTENLEFEPAISPDGQFIAYTVEKGGKFEVWMASVTGENPTFVALGRQPRFSPNGRQLAYTRIDLNGNEDIWKIDIGAGIAERMTDADEIDETADWSPDGQSIVFSSARGGEMSLWQIPASGGKRLRLNDGGYAPRYSRDGRSIAYWNKQALWTMDASGRNSRNVAQLTEPAAPIWMGSGLAFFVEGTIRATDGTVHDPRTPIWPWFDRLPSGEWVIARIAIRETELWAVDLTFKER